MPGARAERHAPLQRGGDRLREERLLGREGVAPGVVLRPPSAGSCEPNVLKGSPPGEGVRTSMRNLAGIAPGTHRGVALLVMTLLFCVTALAYAEPPDPLWTGGIWDDDDFDSNVAVVKTTEVPCESASVVVVPLEPCLYAPPPPPVWRPILRTVSWPENRAPPAI